METNPGQNVAIMRRFVFEVQEKGKFDLIDEFVHPDFYNHTTEGDLRSGVSNAQMVMRGLHAAFADIKMEIEHCICQGNVIATNKILRGRQVGEFGGIPASNKLVETRIIDVVTIVDGKFREHWATLGPLTVVGE